MVDLAEAIAKEPNASLEQRWRNAKALLIREPDSPKGIRAAQLMDLIDAERARRSLPGAIEAFLEEFPRGFEDDRYMKQERDDKVDASKAAKSSLEPQAFEAALEGDPMPLLLEVKRIVNMTNLIQGSFEKPKLFDAMLDPQHALGFTRALNALLHGRGDAPERLEEFSDYLHSLGLRKWTYGTYFLFLHKPDNCIFVKPESLKKAADKAVFDIQYDAAPTANGYRRILEFARWVEARLVREQIPPLVPKDLIDVQSFVWFMAPTGKFARA